MLREAGAAEVHVRVASPPVSWPCFYGIDFATRAELIAGRLSTDEICTSIGADSLGYVSLAGLIEATDARADPQALADALIFTPNRRAARELALALYRAMGSTLLVPTIRALGDAEAEDAATAFGADALNLPPALPAARRRGALARLIQRWRAVRFDPPLPPASAFMAPANALASNAGVVLPVAGSKRSARVLPSACSRYTRVPSSSQLAPLTTWSTSGPVRSPSIFAARA